jgi:arylsulfatase A-like enzyme
VQEGVSFTRAYCQSPICTPSRASFMSGLYPSTVHVNYNGNDTFPDHVPVVSGLFADTGYECGLIGKLHIASAQKRVEKRTNDGYSYWQYSHAPHWKVTDGNDYLSWLESKGEEREELLADQRGFPSRLHHTTWCAEKTMEFLHNHSGRTPWFVSLNIFGPHPPFNPPREYMDMYDPDAMAGPLFQDSDLARQEKLASITFKRKAQHPSHLDIGERAGMTSNYLKGRKDAGALKAFYYAEISHIDEQIGRILDYLNQTDQRENTVIIFTSDHGDMLGDHGLLYKGCRFYDGLVRVPLIWSWPSRFQSDLRASALIELTDITPTLLDLAGLEIPIHMQGRSLKGILTGAGNPDNFRDFVRSEYYNAVDNPYQGKDQIATMYRDIRYKLVVYHGHGLGELYDMENDPGEFQNLWDFPEYSQLKFDLLWRSYDATAAAQDWGAPRVGEH